MASVTPTTTRAVAVTPSNQAPLSSSHPHLYRRLQGPLVVPTRLLKPTPPPSPEMTELANAFLKGCVDFEPTFFKDLFTSDPQLLENDSVSQLCEKHTPLASKYSQLLTKYKALTKRSAELSRRDELLPLPEAFLPDVLKYSPLLKESLKILIKLEYYAPGVLEAFIAQREAPKQPEDPELQLKISQIISSNYQLEFNIASIYCSILQKRNNPYPIWCALNRRKLQIKELAFQAAVEYTLIDQQPRI